MNEEMSNNLIQTILDKAKEAVDELKELDTILTRIKQSDSRLSDSELSALAERSFSVSSQYGKSAADYLTTFQSLSETGYENAQSMAELSLALQSAGNITADLANQYLIAADHGYQLGGSIQSLTELLDGTASISSSHAVNMQELADGMSLLSSHAGETGTGIAETAAALAAMLSVTGESGSDLADAFHAILLNLKQLTDEENGISTDGLTRYEDACNALNVSLRETKSGITSLRAPMDTLKDLSISYSSLSPEDSRRTDLLESVGGGIRGDALNALLENWDLYEQMLSRYQNGAGSLTLMAEQTADSWEGSLSRLSSTWTDTIGNFADSDAAAAGINTLNELLSVINHITEAIGPLASASLIGGGILGMKNAGKPV